jgi:hypothetical protein
MAREAGGEVRIGTRSDNHLSQNGTRWTPFKPGDRATHHLRVVLPHESVFDIGDDRRDGFGALVPTPWGRIVEETYALWLALNRMKIPYWGALSGGKGTHTHIFGTPGSNPAAEVERESRGGRFVEAATCTPRQAIDSAPPCVRRAVRALAAGKNVPHAGRFLVGTYFHHAGFDAAAIRGLFVRTPNFNEKKTMDSLNGIADKNYLPMSCARLQAEGICHDYIKESRCDKVRNPVSWLAHRKSEDSRANGAVAEPEAVEEGPTDWRNAATGSILEVANAILEQITGIPGDTVEADHRLLSPPKNGRLVREFGRRKAVSAKTRKVLWTVGYGPFAPIPGERKDAYAVAEAKGTVFPSAIPRSADLPLFDRTAELRLAPPGALCPIGPKCVPHHPSWSGANPRGCDTCPLRGTNP